MMIHNKGLGCPAVCAAVIELREKLGPKVVPNRLVDVISRKRTPLTITLAKVRLSWVSPAVPCDCHLSGRGRAVSEKWRVVAAEAAQGAGECPR